MDPTLNKTQVMTNSFFEMAQAITESGKYDLCKEVELFCSNILLQCCEARKTPHGNRVLLHPPLSKKRKSKGTSLMR